MRIPAPSLARTLKALHLLWCACLLPGAGAAIALPADMEPPTLKLAGIRVIDLRPERQIFAVKLLVGNPNMFDIPLRSVDCHIEINGQSLAHGTRDQPITLPGGGEQVVELRAVTSLNELLRQIRTMVAEGDTSASYRIRGEVRVGDGTVPMPFDQRGALDLRELMGLHRDRAPPAPEPDYI
ncbi:MAG: LEA type 2 family protein [Gammaproteobacteria bacterium]|nr:LEA type 2 family protein [Gammaproteobacteria bacterium]